MRMIIATSTRIRIFILKMQPFLSVSEGDPRPHMERLHKQRLQKYPRPHENAVAFEIRNWTMIFDIGTSDKKDQ